MSGGHLRLLTKLSSRFVLQSRTQLTRCWGTVPSSFPSLPRVASSGTEAWRTPFRGLPHTGQLALPAALGTRWSPCRSPSRDAQTEDLRSPTSTGLGRGVAAPFARRRPNRGHVKYSCAPGLLFFRTLSVKFEKCERKTGRGATARLQTRSDRDFHTSAHTRTVQ